MVNIFELAKKSKDAALARYFPAKAKASNPGYNKDGRDATAYTKTPIEFRKDGGKVEGVKPKMRLDKKPRKKAGGGTVDSTAPEAKQMEDATQVVNAAQARKKRLAGVGIGGMKKGGKICKADGGEISDEDKLGMNELVRSIDKEKTQKEIDEDPTRGSKYAGEKDFKRGGKVKKKTSDNDDDDKYKRGGKVKNKVSDHADEVQDKKLIKKMIDNEDKKEAFKRGGAVKGKTSINIVIAPSGGSAPSGGLFAPGGIAPSGPVGAMPMPPVPPMPMGIPDMPPPPMGGAPMGPIAMRKAGGSVGMKFGAGGGKGRLQKIEKYGK